MRLALRSLGALALLVAGLALPAAPAYAAAHSVSDQASCGALPVATTWTAAGSICRLDASWTVGPGDTLVVALGTTLSVPGGITLTNQGGYTNNGKLSVDGGTFANSGAFDNVNYVDMRSSATFTNSAGGAVTTRNQFYLLASSHAENAGTLTITAAPSVLSVDSTSSLTNTGTVANQGRLNVQGTLANPGSVTNTGALTFDCGTLTGNPISGTPPVVINCLKAPGGVWEDPTVWTAGQVPSPGDEVRVFGNSSIGADLSRTGVTHIQGKLTVPAGLRLDNAGTMKVEFVGALGASQLIVVGELHNTGVLDVVDTLTVKGYAENAGSVGQTTSATGALTVMAGGQFVNTSGHTTAGGLDVRAGGDFDNFGTLYLNRSDNFNAGELTNKPGATVNLGNSLTNKAGGVFRNEGTFETSHRLSLAPVIVNEAGAIWANLDGSMLRILSAGITWTNSGSTEHRGTWQNAGALSNPGSFCGPGAVTGNSMTGNAQVASCDPVVTLAPIDAVAEGHPSTVASTFQDPGLPDSFTAVVDWGDGATTNPTVIASGLSRSFSTTHTYSAPGPYDVQATVCAVGGGCVVANGSASVSVNQPPVAGDDTASIAEDTLLTRTSAQLVANDGDGDGDPLTVTAVSDPTNGTVSLTSGSVTFTSAADFHGTGGFDYTVSDGLATDTGHVTVTVTPVNDPPAAHDDALTTAEDDPVSRVAGQLVADDADIDGDPLTLTQVSDPLHGSVELVGGVVTFTPAPNYTGSAGFDYTVSDGALTDSGHVSVSVTPVNDAPISLDDASTTDEDVGILVDVTANDFDQEGAVLVVSIATPAANGTATVVGGGIGYVPDPDWSGTDTFTYSAGDGSGGTDTAIVEVTVNPVNDAPVAADDAIATSADTPVDVPAGELAADDTDVDSDALATTGVSNPTHGTVSLDTGTVTFTPEPGFVGSAGFDYTVSDGSATDVGHVVVAVSSAPDLAVTQVAPARAGVGNTVTFTITVTNDGSAAAVGPVLNGTLPPAFRVRSTAAGCTLAGPDLSCALGDVAPGATALVSVTGAFTAPGHRTSSVVVDADGDSDLSDNTAATNVDVTGKACTITGTFGNDNLVGTTSGDVLCGLAGNDVLNGKQGSDVMYGNEGTDMISFASLAMAVRLDLALGSATGQGSDQFTGIENATGSGRADVLRGNAQANTLKGGAGDDKLYGLAGNDRLYGGAGADLVRGGNGNDLLSGGSGDDVLCGEAGTDTPTDGVDTCR